MGTKKSVQFDGKKWERPVVDLKLVAEFDKAVGEWMRKRQRPKLLISTQTKVIEVVVDEKGDWVPLTPLIIVEPQEEDYMGPCCITFFSDSKCFSGTSNRRRSPLS